MNTIEKKYGFGMFKFSYLDELNFGHTGGIDGFRSFTIYFPKDKLAISMTSNALNYSQKDDLILDPMLGSGTTVIEAKLLDRQSIGIDVNPAALKLAKSKVNFNGDYKYEPKLIKGDIRNLNQINSSSVDLIITHPPYFNIIDYSNGKIKDDLSNVSDLSVFLDEFKNVIDEFYRVLKKGSYCAILIGDTRKHGHYVPLSYYILDIFLKTGFILKEEIIKLQHNCKHSSYWRNKIKNYSFYLIKHEHLFVFRKARNESDLEKYKYSCKLK
jgi:DNA modification methylase